MAELPQLRPTTALHAVYPHRLLVPKDKREMVRGWKLVVPIAFILFYFSQL
jgi:hypothetical protein